ncbi:hypothetical protein [Amycolatopsis sp. NPDC057786]|uniref:hypothetical protein n=1 Tax=Amycolatopsis sp. NPDC057786 TaxID=3346250 RepID=UPI003672C387
MLALFVPISASAQGQAESGPREIQVVNGDRTGHRTTGIGAGAGQPPVPGLEASPGQNRVLLLSRQNEHVGFADVGDVVAQNGTFTPPAC